MAKNDVVVENLDAEKKENLIVDEKENKFVLNGNIFKAAETFTLVSGSNYKFEIKTFMGEEIPQPALATFENFWAGVCIGLGNLTGMESEKIAKRLRKECARQKFSTHIETGDARIFYSKTTNKSEINWDLDGKLLLDLLLGVNYGDEVSDEEIVAITW